MKKLTNEQWLSIATANKEDVQGTFAEPMHLTHGGFSGNQYVLHYIGRKIQCECEYCKDGKTPDFNIYLPMNWTYQAVVNTKDLLRLTRSNQNNTKLEITQELVKINDIAILGEISVKRAYSVSVIVNRKYLLNAIKGMGEKCVIELQSSSNAPVVLHATDSERKAVMMPVSK